MSVQLTTIPPRSAGARTQWLLFIAVVTCISLALGYRFYAERQRIEADELERLNTTSQFIESAIGRQFTAITHALDAMRDEFPDWDFAKQGPAEANQYMKAMSGAMPGVRTLLVLDASGLLLASNRTELVGRNFQSRDYFQVVAQAPKAGTLYLTPPFKSVLGIWTMALGRSLTLQDNEFGGVVVASLEQTEFKYLLNAAHYAQDLRISLYQDGRNLFVSVPENEEASTDGTESLSIVRSFATGNLPVSSPMSLHLSRDRAALFAAWREQLWIQGGTLVALVLVLALILLVMQRRQSAQAALVLAYEEQNQANQRALQRSEEHNRMIVEAISVGAMEVDMVSGQVQCDEKWFAMLGFAPNAFSMSLDDWFWRMHPDDVGAVRAAVEAMRTAPETRRQEFRFRNNADGWQWLIMHGRVVEWRGADPVRSIITQTDIAARKATEAVLRASEARVRSLLVAMQDLVFLIDTGGVLVEYYQPAVEQPFFPAVDGFVGREYSAVFPDHVAALLTESIGNVLMQDTAWSFEYELKMTAGTRSYSCSLSAVKGDDARFPVGFLAVVRDITHQKTVEAQIRSLALYDALTGLPNRRLLDDRVGQALVACTRDQQHGALLFLDLDRFKLLNDTHGHDAGDQLLCEVARRLQTQVRGMDTVARLGGDEFIVMLEALASDAAQARAEAGVVAEKIRLALCAPYQIGSATSDAASSLTWECSSSIGVALFPAPDMDDGELFRRADQAMYAAKSAGRNTIRFAATP